MLALSTLEVAHCENLTSDWLPSSSASSVRTLDAHFSTLVRLPEDMTALRDVNVEDCERLAADWISTQQRGRST
jgi:hypothetical protein